MVAKATADFADSFNPNDPFEDTESATLPTGRSEVSECFNPNDPFEDTESGHVELCIPHRRSVSTPTIRSRILKAPSHQRRAEHQHYHGPANDPFEDTESSFTTLPSRA